MSIRRRLILTAIGGLAALSTMVPVHADSGGVPHDGSCGLGKKTAHDAIANTAGPGASEAAKQHGQDCH